MATGFFTSSAAASDSPQTRESTPSTAMNSGFAVHGQDARNTLQLRLLENEEMSDALSGLAFLRALPEVDAREVATIGHSFGGSFTLLLAERDPNLRAVVIFSGAGYSWDRSAPLRARLLDAVAHVTAPVFFMLPTTSHSQPAKRWTHGLSSLASHTARSSIHPSGTRPKTGTASSIWV